MKNRHRGFTLLELMLVLTIAGLLLGLGVPAMGNFIRNSRITAAANDVMVALHLARSEAIKRRQAVSVCTTANPQDADPVCANSAMLQGWIVFVDADQDGQRDPQSFTDIDGDGFQDPANEDLNGNGALDPGEDTDLDGNLDVAEPTIPADGVLLAREPLPASVTARASANPLRVTYLDNGFALNANAAQLVLCDERGNTPSGGQLSAARGITISATGRAGVTRDKDEIQTLIDDIGAAIGGCTTS